MHENLSNCPKISGMIGSVVALQVKSERSTNRESTALFAFRFTECEPRYQVSVPRWFPIIGVGVALISTVVIK